MPAHFLYFQIKIPMSLEYWVKWLPTVPSCLDLTKSSRNPAQAVVSLLSQALVLRLLSLGTFPVVGC